MEERADANACDSTAISLSAIRLFVGGLAESVSSNDLHKIFSSFGSIRSLEFVRTKGRSFAYVDFLPSSHLSLSKLFSTYNGCAWKGGRIRLEKAKEHYLARLRQEWDQRDDALLLTHPKIDSSHHSDSHIHSPDSKLRIYFPKLRKVKAIPFSGTGKHKYSFRRVEVPSLPTYFCDCEEHSGAPDDTGVKCSPILEENGAGVSKEEFELMNSVMYKLFARENVLNTSVDEAEPAQEEETTIRAVDDGQLEEDEGYSSANEDNLVLNVVNSRQQPVSSDCFALSNAKESGIIRLEASEGNPRHDLHKKWRSNFKSPKKRKSILVDQDAATKSSSDIIEGNANLQTSFKESVAKQSNPSLSWSQESSWNSFVGGGDNREFSLSDVLPNISSCKENDIKSHYEPNSNDSKDIELLRSEEHEVQLSKTSKVKEPAEAPSSKSGSASSKSGRGSAWLQKSSWTQLVGGGNNSMFSITQILPCDSFHGQEPTEQEMEKVIKPPQNNHGNNVELKKSISTTDASGDLEIGNNEQSTRETSQEVGVGNMLSPMVMDQKNNSASKQKKSNVDVPFGETCSFMRTATSVKEWVNTKAALSGTRNRKHGEK